MAYTPFTWLDTAAGNTPITAPRLNAIEQGIANASADAASALAAAGQIPNVTPQSKYLFNVMDYGAVGDGVTDDRDAIQKAIDAAAALYNISGAPSEVYIPGRKFGIKVVTYYQNNGTPNGQVSLMLKSGVHLTGHGTLFAIGGNAYIGTFLRLIGSSDAGIQDAGIHNITIDGNSPNQYYSQQCGNIGLIAKSNIEISSVRCINANGTGISVVGVFAPNGGNNINPANGVNIHHNYVTGCTMIGIQCGHIDKLSINDNIVEYCTNNCIDIYGDPGANNGGTTCNNFTINNNTCRNGLIGVFPETVSNGTVNGNMLFAMSESGVHINRGNATVNNILVSGNTINGSPRGISVTGDMGRAVVLQGNLISGVSQAGVQLGQAGYNSSYVMILDNYIDTVQINATPLVLFTGNQSAFNRVRGTITQNTDRGWDNVFYNLTTSVGNVTSPANAA